MEPILLQTSEADAGTRLDACLARAIEDLTRSAAAKAVEDGRVLVNGKAPKPDDLTGYEAVALENIAGSGYGKVRVKYNGLNYRFDAISVYHTDIESGEKVDIVTGEDELLFVQKKDEIYKVLDEEKTPVTKAETDITPEPKRKNDSFVSSEEINNNRKEE